MRAPLLICLEGPDASGKTTLANAIIAQAKSDGFSTHYEHCGYRFKDRMNTYHTAALWRCLKSGDDVAVIDRWWVSEEIYAHVYRNGTKWPQSGRLLDRIFLRFSGLYVVCAPLNAEVAYHRAKDRQDDELYWKKNADVCHLYHAWMDTKYGFSYPRECYGSLGSGYDAHWYDRDRHTPEDSARSILRQARARRDSACEFEQLIDPNFFNLAGNHAAKVIMVGDETNSKLRNKRLSWPFFEHANSSLYLARALQIARVPEDNLLWFNAHDVGASSHLEKIRNRQFIALGKRAADWLDENQVETYHKIPHPQHARRFAFNQVEDYARILAQAITR